MDITFDFACRDDCLNHMVPSDLRKIVSERDALRAFAQDVMRAWPEGDVDGGDLQAAALRHGLLAEAEPTQEERGENGLEEGDLWYRKTSLLTANVELSPC